MFKIQSLNVWIKKQKKERSLEYLSLVFVDT